MRNIDASSIDFLGLYNQLSMQSVIWFCQHGCSRRYNYFTSLKNDRFLDFLNNSLKCPKLTIVLVY